MLTESTASSPVLRSNVMLSQVLAVWNMQQGLDSNHRTSSGLYLGNMPKRDRPEGSYDTTGSFLARLKGSNDRGRSRITVCRFETPKSCIIFADDTPGTVTLRRRVGSSSGVAGVRFHVGGITE